MMMREPSNYRQGRAYLAVQSLELLQHGIRRWPVGLAAANVLPAYDAVLVDDEGGSIGDFTVKQAIVFDDAYIRIVEDGERGTPFIRRRFRSFKIVCADGENDCVAFLYIVVVVCQLDELSAAERSPERSVED